MKELKELRSCNFYDFLETNEEVGFVWKNKEGELIGFKVPKNKIEFCNYELLNEVMRD